MSSQRKLSDFFRTAQGTDCSSDLALEASGSQVADHTAVSSDTPEIGKFCYKLLDEIRLVDHNDFGRAVEEGRSRVASDEKARWLERDQSWKPPRTFDWPFQLRKRNGVDEKRFLKPEDLEREEARWISYSQLKKGLFCRACFFFSTVRNAAFVDKPYTRYGYLWGRENGITHHITREYHVQAVDSAQLFLKPIGHIDRNFSETDRRVNDAGKHVMKPKIEAAIRLAKLGLPFRGRRDGGEIQIIEQISEFTGEEGCFRALLQFGAMKSSVEKEALEEANRLPGYASYFSPNIQNQLIQCIGDVIRAKIVKDVCKTGSYAILADETTDISGLCQMALFARYVDVEDSFKICEQFIGMVELSGGTGEHLAAKIIEFVKKCGLEKAKMIGQGYDGAGAMSGVHSGCQTSVRSVHPSAIYVHCSAHNLNLALANASSIAEVKSVMGLISDVHDFFKNHHFVQEFLKEAIKKSEGMDRRTVKNVCRTRWVESHAACADFNVIYQAVLGALVECSKQCSQPEARAKARSLVIQLCDPSFTFTMVFLSKCMLVLKGLSELLQKVDIDLTLACGEVEVAIARFKKWRASYGVNETGSFGSIEALAAVQYRRAAAWMNRLNNRCYSTGSEQCFKAPVYDAFLNALINALEYRFGAHFTLAASISRLLPRTVVETDFNVVQPVIEFYVETDFIQCTVEEIQSQFEAWKTRCELLDETQRKLGVKDALKLSNRESTKLIHRLLLAYAAIPLSSATCERSFSGLKRIKTWLRNRTVEERLDGLAVAHLNKSTSVSFEEVKALFDSKQQRRYNPPPTKKQHRALPIEKDEDVDMSSDSDSPFVAFDNESDGE